MDTIKQIEFEDRHGAIKVLKAKLESSKEKNIGFERELKSVSKEVGELKAKLESSKERNNRYEQELNSQDKKVGELTAALESSREQLKTVGELKAALKSSNDMNRRYEKDLQDANKDINMFRRGMQLSEERCNEFKQRAQSLQKRSYWSMIIWTGIPWIGLLWIGTDAKLNASNDVKAAVCVIGIAAVGLGTVTVILKAAWGKVFGSGDALPSKE